MAVFFPNRSIFISLYSCFGVRKAKLVCTTSSHCYTVPWTWLTGGYKTIFLFISHNFHFLPHRFHFHLNSFWKIYTAKHTELSTLKEKPRFHFKLHELISFRSYYFWSCWEKEHVTESKEKEKRQKEHSIPRLPKNFCMMVREQTHFRNTFIMWILTAYNIWFKKADLSNWQPSVSDTKIHCRSNFKMDFTTAKPDHILLPIEGHCSFTGLWNFAQCSCPHLLIIWEVQWKRRRDCSKKVTKALFRMEKKCISLPVEETYK